jgi:hypothetical protein
MGGAEALASLVSGELAQPVPDAVSRLAEAIRSRTGPATAAILFYGSCLRKHTAEGVLDFYVLVDGYRDANPGRRLALANALLPPNVFYLELDALPEPLRAKYAVVSLADFERGAAGRWLRTGMPLHPATSNTPRSDFALPSDRYPAKIAAARAHSHGSTGRDL